MTSITLITAPSCHLCNQAKDVLDRVAADHRVTVETISIATGPGRLLMHKHGVVFPPGVLIDDKPFSYGRLSERRLRRELDRQESPAPQRHEDSGKEAGPSGVSL